MSSHVHNYRGKKLVLTPDNEAPGWEKAARYVVLQLTDDTLRPVYVRQYTLTRHRLFVTMPDGAEWSFLYEVFEP